MATRIRALAIVAYSKIVWKWDPRCEWVNVQTQSSFIVSIVGTLRNRLHTHINKQKCIRCWRLDTSIRILARLARAPVDGAPCTRSTNKHKWMHADTECAAYATTRMQNHFIYFRPFAGSIVDLSMDDTVEECSSAANGQFCVLDKHRSHAMHESIAFAHFNIVITLAVSIRTHSHQRLAAARIWQEWGKGSKCNDLLIESSVWWPLHCCTG